MGFYYFTKCLSFFICCGVLCLTKTCAGVFIQVNREPVSIFTMAAANTSYKERVSALFTEMTPSMYEDDDDTPQLSATQVKDLLDAVVERTEALVELLRGLCIMVFLLALLCQGLFFCVCVFWSTVLLILTESCACFRNSRR